MDKLLEVAQTKQITSWTERASQHDHDPQRLYDQWLGSLSEWLGVEAGIVGNFHTKRKTVHAHARSNIRTRSYVNHNMLIKANAWAKEILAKLYKEEDFWHWRVQQLTTMLKRLPWDKWNIHPPPEDWALNPWQLWYDNDWQDALQKLIDLSTHHLAKWRKLTRQAASGNGMRRMSMWIKGPRQAPAVWHQGRAEVAPDRVVNIMTEAWQQELQPEVFQDTMEQTDKDNLLATMHPFKACLAPLDAHMLYECDLSRDFSSPGFDAISNTMLRALPFTAWEALAKCLQAVEGTSTWPVQLLMVMCIPIPKAGCDGLQPPLKQRVISTGSHIYRLWSSTRCKQLIRKWLLHKVIPPTLHRVYRDALPA